MVANIREFDIIMLYISDEASANSNIFHHLQKGRQIGEKRCENKEIYAGFKKVWMRKLRTLFPSVSVLR